MNEMVVVYGTGAIDRLPVRYNITPGTDSRIYDLRGNDRVIRRIDLTYRSMRNSHHKARVEGWGLH